MFINRITFTCQWIFYIALINLLFAIRTEQTNKIVKRVNFFMGLTLFYYVILPRDLSRFEYKSDKIKNMCIKFKNVYFFIITNTFFFHIRNQEVSSYALLWWKSDEKSAFSQRNNWQLPYPVLHIPNDQLIFIHFMNIVKNPPNFRLYTP